MVRDVDGRGRLCTGGVARVHGKSLPSLFCCESRKALKHSLIKYANNYHSFTHSK